MALGIYIYGAEAKKKKHNSKDVRRMFGRSSCEEYRCFLVNGGKLEMPHVL